MVHSLVSIYFDSPQLDIQKKQNLYSFRMSYYIPITDQVSFSACLHLLRNGGISMLQLSVSQAGTSKLKVKLKVKLWWVGVHERKKSGFFVTLSLSEGNFF